MKLGTRLHKLLKQQEINSAFLADYIGDFGRKYSSYLS